MMNTLIDAEPKTNYLARNLAYLLKNRGVSEMDIAQALAIPVMTVRRIVSGETLDPRISTLKMIADYFQVPVDALMESPDLPTLKLASVNKHIFVPILDWAYPEQITSFNKNHRATWTAWQPIYYPDAQHMDQDAFALKSLPSMYPRFPKGTLFVIAPHIKPFDGDKILIQVKKNKEISLKEFIIDPPEKKIASIIQDTHTYPFDEKQYTILGVVILTLLFTKRDV